MDGCKQIVFFGRVDQIGFLGSCQFCREFGVLGGEKIDGLAVTVRLPFDVGATLAARGWSLGVL
jgi:hypothetical protein